ncbi:hypothetical protein NQ314_015248 [Rhamnusium bicolor]|uniref:Uncharacterized protein n=1 Tax=Rhamnusium bicolor TaxID=1586634 RepID=A0AAV8WZT8_9CUCU|nr:hypothetical protein NQ314_015248 [Rhamnusium bicolor]
MILYRYIFSILLNIYVSNGEIFLWSNKKLEISPLRPFKMEQFSNLIKELDNPEVYIFKSPSRVSPDIKEITDGYYSAYIPNGDINVQNATDLVGDGELDVFNIREIQKGTNISANILSVIVVPKKQYKRDVNGDEIMATPTEGEKTTTQPLVSKGPVIYKSQNKKR